MTTTGTNTGNKKNGKLHWKSKYKSHLARYQLKIKCRVDDGPATGEVAPVH